MQEFDRMSEWVGLVSILPIAFSIITIGLLGSALFKVTKMMQLCDRIASSAHWLSRTAVRAGIGETARNTITEYAKTKPELHRLLK